MPCLKIFTNLPKSKIPIGFHSKIVPVLSKAVKKEEYKFIVLISGDNYFAHDGDDTTPGAVATIESIGHLGPEENNVIIKAVSDLLEKELGIPNTRFLLTFYDLQPHNVSIAGNIIVTP